MPQSLSSVKKTNPKTPKINAIAFICKVFFLKLKKTKKWAFEFWCFFVICGLKFESFYY